MTEPSRWHDPAYESAAAAFGLRYRAATVRAIATGEVGVAEGEVEGLWVALRKTVYKEQSSCQVAVLLRPTLDLGLDIRSAGLLDTVASWFGRRDIEVGERLFDDNLLVHGDDGDRVRALLGDRLREALYPLGRDGRPFRLDDEAFVAVDALAATAPSISANIEEALAIARLVQDARQEVPIPAELGLLADAWGELAARSGGALWRTPLTVGLGPALGNAWLRARRVGRLRFETQILAPFEERLGLGLEVVRRGDRVLSWLQREVLLSAQQTGDPAFDDAFTLRAAVPPSEVAALLDGPTRAALVALARDHVVSVSDEAVAVVFGEDQGAPEAQGPLIARLAEVADGISAARRAARGPTAPYRG